MQKPIKIACCFKKKFSILFFAFILIVKIEAMNLNLECKNQKIESLLSYSADQYATGEWTNANLKERKKFLKKTQTKLVDQLSKAVEESTDIPVEEYQKQLAEYQKQRDLIKAVLQNRKLIQHNAYLRAAKLPTISTLTSSSTSIATVSESTALASSSSKSTTSCSLSSSPASTSSPSLAPSPFSSSSSSSTLASSSTSSLGTPAINSSQESISLSNSGIKLIITCDRLLGRWTFSGSPTYDCYYLPGLQLSNCSDCLGCYNLNGQNYNCYLANKTTTPVVLATDISSGTVMQNNVTFCTLY